jgi:hypothetical protein
VGSEAVCSVRFGDQVSEGKALLETSELLFRGDFRLRIAFRDITSLRSEDGELEVCFDGQVARFDLGRNAEVWAEKIRNPRGLLDKLGVKPGARVSVLGVEDEAFLAQLSGRGVAPASEPESEQDFVFYAAAAPADLAQLPALASAIKSNGAIWVVSPKGKAARLKDVEVMAAARDAGLVDTKVVAFSPTHTALKLVIPKARR